ncbi:hypothetical protein CPB86DRAFT_809214 [Serendipita vermifera]|nr:hypothetical protein CPB86DRAFT_809214 [Serendipita vermifera]
MSNDHELDAEPLLSQDYDTPIYHLIHQIRQVRPDTPLSYEDLTGAELTYAFVKPLEEKYAKLENKATVFCFLLNRVYFIRDPNFATASLNRSRAVLCEILATRTIRQWSNLIELANVLITSWVVYEGCSEEIIAKGRELQNDFDPMEKVGNAMEMAIISDAKLFVKSAPCQKVIDAIWSGKIVYTAESSRSLIRDAYKRSPIHYYDPRKAPLLDHYRLKIPAIRSVLEYGNFLVLFVLFVITLEFYDPDNINTHEKIFMVYASGFVLEKLAAVQEHGLRVYIHGTWNGFDVAFILIFIPYITLRLFGVVEDARWARVAGMDCLALAACLLFPRLAFVTLSNNLLVLAFRAMFTEFFMLMGIAVFCFTGFLYTLWTLSRGTFAYSPGRIAWWMLDLYFGLDATGFEKSTTFHPIFGPVLMVTFACLSNTLLLTVLVSILSHTFSTLSADAEAEVKFRRAVATIEGVKADVLFSYLPPMNLLAFAIMFPASYILSPRWFHKVNVFMIRVCAAPVLLAITFYERETANLPGTTFSDRVHLATDRLFDSLPRRFRRMTFFEGLAGNGPDIDAVFQIADEIGQSALEMDDGSQHSEFVVQPPSDPVPQQRPRERSFSGQGHLSASAPGQPIQVKSNASEAGTDYSRSRRRSALLSIDTFSPAPQQSPLAQIYQPVIFPDDQNGDEIGFPLGSPTNLVPRRRITSLTRARRPSIEPHQHVPHPARAGGPPPADHMAMPIPPMTVPERAEEEQSFDVGSPADMVEMSRRLVAMEEKQTRIENLLIQLAGEMRKQNK